MPGAGMGEMFNPGETPAPPMMPPAGLGEALTTPNQATVVVTLPADAKLFANGEPIDLIGPVRTFRTPVIEIGKPYHYEMSMEVVRNGQTIKKSQQVLIEAGKIARVIFPEPSAGAGNTAGIPNSAAALVAQR